MIPNVHADQIYQPEGCRFWAADQRASESVHFIHAVIIIQDEIHRECSRPKSHTVADKVGRILAKHDALAQTNFAKVTDELNHILGRVCSRNDLKQFHVARRIKKMCTDEMFLEFLRAAFSYIFNWNS